MSSPLDDSAFNLDDPQYLEPSDAEIEDWAARERRRREVWLKGPSEEQKAAWARRERERRVADVTGYRPASRLGEPSRLIQHYVREAQLATEGAMSMLFRMSLSDAFDQLVRAGREWEAEFTSEPPRRRRVPMDEQSAMAEPGKRSTPSGAPPEASSKPTA